MLSAQRKEFDEKKKDETPYPRDFARWYALDYFRRPRALKARRFFVTLGVTVIVTLFSIASAMPALHQVHHAAPVSKAHAMIGQTCAKCHTQTFQPISRLFGAKNPVSVSNQTCNDCHHGAIHHAKQAHEPACASCHREHQGHEVLASHVADRQCVACHHDLPGHVQPGEKPLFQPTITHFNRDHPEFQPSVKGKKDPSQIKFNHKAHLDLELDDLRRAQEKVGRDDLKGLGAKMACADCHQMDDERRYLKPIHYENHCARCHALNVALVGEFAGNLKQAAAEFSKTPLPHREPQVVRAVLRDRLIEFAQQNGVVSSKAPGVPRPLPWKPVTDEQWSWASEQAKQAEAVLFMNKQWSKIEPLTGCSHCHIEKDRAGGLPVYEKTAIPSRWYPHSVFNHGGHRSIGCTDCHDKNAAGVKVADSTTAADILMPTLQSCQECHKGNGGARNACVECHRYHGRK
jgi:hypothetical protein